MKTWIYIKGALDNKPGDEGLFIGRSQEFESYQLDFISELDKLLQAHLESRNDDTAGEPCVMSRHIQSGNASVLVIIRLLKNFTNFPELARAYHRREYFFFEDLPADRHAVDCIRALPEMIQFSGYDHAYAPAINFVDPPAKAKGELLFPLLSTILSGRGSLPIGITAQGRDEQMLELVRQLPAVYQRYLEVGVNVARSNPLQQHPGIYTTTADDATPLHTFLSQTDNRYTALANDILNDQEYYDDTELRLQHDKSNELTKLIQLHHLFYYLRKNTFPGDKAEQSKIIGQAMQYLTDFFKPEFLKSAQVKQRVAQAWQLLFVSEDWRHDERSYEFVWDIVRGGGPDMKASTVEQYLPGFWNKHNDLAQLIAKRSESIEKLQTKYSFLDNIRDGGNKPVLQTLVDYYVHGKNQISLEDVLSLRKTYNDPATLKKLVGDRLHIAQTGNAPKESLVALLTWMGDHLNASQQNALIARTGSEAMYDYAYKNPKQFFAGKNLVESSSAYMQLDGKNEQEIHKALLWAKLYHDHAKPLRIDAADAERALFQATTSWDLLLKDLKLSAQVWKDKFRPEKIIKSKIASNPSEGLLPLDVMDYIIQNKYTLRIPDDYPGAVDVQDFKRKFSFIRMNPGVFKLQHKTRKLFSLFLEEYDFERNPGSLIDFIQFMESEDIKLLETAREDFAEHLRVLKIPSHQLDTASANSPFIRSLVNPDPNNEHGKKKSGFLNYDSRRRRILFWSGVAIFAAAIAILSVTLVFTKQDLVSTSTELDNLRRQNDSLKAEAKPDQLIYVRQRDTLATFILINPDSLFVKDTLVYVPAPRPR